MVPRVKRLRPKDYESVEKQIGELFRRILFEPMFKAASEPLKKLMRVVLNASDDDLIAAIRAGRIHVKNGVFTGQFSAKISVGLRAIGATFDARTRSYRMNPGSVPPVVQVAATMFEEQSKRIHETIKYNLDQVQGDLDTILDRSKIRYDRTIDRAVADFRDVAKLIGVPSDLSPQAKKQLEADYNRSTKMPIRTFLEDEIVELRSRVEANALIGGRFDSLVDVIKDRYDVALNKARFLARQETSLFTSKFHERRFAEAGVVKYVWSTSHDERVRPIATATGKGRLNDHRALDGREFFFSSPPVVDKATGRRANPGEDFNCRCVPIPVIDRRSTTPAD